MDIVWERENRFSDTLEDLEGGTVVLLMSRQEAGPFLVTDCTDSCNCSLLFNFNENVSEFFDQDERVEVLQAELHIF